METRELPAALSLQVPDESQFAEFLQLMQIEAVDYLEKALAMMHMTWEEFTGLVRTVGQVQVVCHEQAPVGYIWIEKRENTLHLHGLFIKRECQGKGYGKAVLRYLDGAYRGEVDVIELGVHESNARARALYEKVGFETVRRMPDMGFEIMHLRVGGLNT